MLASTARTPATSNWQGVITDVAALVAATPDLDAEQSGGNGGTDEAGSSDGPAAEQSGPDDERGSGDEPGRSTDPEFAKLGSRIGAHAIDVLVLVPVFWVTMMAVAMGTGNMGGGGFSMSGAPAVIAFGLFFVLMAAYFVFTEGLFGWTPGKRLVGLQVVDDDGEIPGLGPAAARNVTRLVEGAPFFWFFLFYPVSLVLVNENGRRLGDRFANTAVVAAD